MNLIKKIMKNFLIGWIIFQLIAVGIAGGYQLIEIKNGNYCKEADTSTMSWIKDDKNGSNFSIYLASILFPLIFFMPDTLDYNKICNNN